MGPSISLTLVCLTNYTCVRVDRQYYNVRMAGFFSSWWVEWDSGCGCVWGGRDGGGRQHVIHACSSFSRSQYWMSGHHLSLSRSFEPPIFRQLILPTNAVAAAMATYLAFFVLLLGKFSIRILQNETDVLAWRTPIQTKSTPFRTCRSCPPSCSWVSWPGLKTTERWSPRARTLHSEREERPFSHLLLSCKEMWLLLSAIRWMGIRNPQRES